MPRRRLPNARPLPSWATPESSVAPMEGRAPSRGNTVSIVHLHEKPDHLSLVASWIHTAFWTRSPHDVNYVADLIRKATTSDSIPLSLLALVGNEPAGTVQLVRTDSRERPDLTPWLAALYVTPEHRHQGIGGALVRELASEARRLGCGEVFLETDIPDFYAREGGATRFQSLAEGGWIMRIGLS